MTSAELLERITRESAETNRLREARRANLYNKRATPRKCLVAWVDVLGFSDQIKAADDEDKFQTIYRRILSIQDAFSKDSASPEPAQREMNESFGMRVIALSDGLVMTLELEGFEDHPWSLGERIRSFLHEVRLAQATCVTLGNFLRGGIAVGKFYFENEILLSPAFVKAYEMETKKAVVPVILIEKPIAATLRAWATENDEDPVTDLFRDCEWMKPEDQEAYEMIDFMKSFPEFNHPEHRLRSYDATLRRELQGKSEKVAAKYRWLIKYANEYIQQFPSLREELFILPPLPKTKAKWPAFVMVAGLIGVFSSLLFLRRK